jgi:nicotinate-nucleotide adenylyltransferase
MLNQLSTWHQPDALLREVSFHVLERPGHPIDWANLPPAIRTLENRVVPAPQIDISATDIRSRVRRGLPIDFLTPEAVVRYIRVKGLYKPDL